MQKFAVVMFAVAACATSGSKPDATTSSSSGTSSSGGMSAAGGPTTSGGTSGGMATSSTAGGTGSSSMASGSSGGSASGSFKATLSARNEVPPPTVDPRSAPSGSATFTVNGSSLTYKVSVTGLSSPYIGAHIHQGAPGVAGPVLVPLNLSAAGQGEAAGEGTIDASGIKGKKADGSPMTMDDLVAALQSGQTYVNVHTQNNKPGEARGQIQ